MPFVASGDGDGLDWHDVRGLTVAGGHLYYARANGALYRIALRNGRPVPGTDGRIDTSRNWASRGLFVFPR